MKSKIVHWQLPLCVASFIIITVILAGGLLFSLFQVFGTVYVPVAEYLFWLFWLVTIGFMGTVLAGAAKDKEAKREKQKGKKRKGKKKQTKTGSLIFQKWTWRLIVPAMLMVCESLLLIDNAIFLILLFIILLLLTTSGKTLTKPGEQHKYILVHYGLITALSTVFILFQGLLLSDPFKHSFLKIAGEFDKVMFGGAAAKAGRGIGAFSTDSFLNASPESFAKQFGIYIHRLETGNLNPGDTPADKTKAGPSVHDAAIKKSLEMFDNLKAKEKKIAVIDHLLDYLSTLVRKKYLNKLPANTTYLFTIRLQQEIIDRLEREGLGKIPSILEKLQRFYCALSTHTHISSQTIRDYLNKQNPGKKVKPCPPK